jgi:hypothetical protein
MLERQHDFLPRKEFAERLGLHLRGRPYSERCIVEWQRTGRGPPAIKIGRFTFFSWSTAMRWLDGKNAKAGAANAAKKERAA